MTTTFSGLPINGDIVFGGEDRKEQRTEEEFLAILQPVLDDPRTVSLTWTQYTPYFNDGDPCVFGAQFHAMDVRVGETVTTIEDSLPTWIADYNADERAAIGCRNWKDNDTYTGPDEAYYDACKAVEDALGEGEFDDVLLKKFGDHAEVKVVPNDGIYIEFYDHD